MGQRNADIHFSYFSNFPFSVDTTGLSHGDLLLHGHVYDGSTAARPNTTSLLDVSRWRGHGHPLPSWEIQSPSYWRILTISVAIALEGGMQLDCWRSLDDNGRRPVVVTGNADVVPGFVVPVDQFYCSTVPETVGGLLCTDAMDGCSPLWFMLLMIARL